MERVRHSSLLAAREGVTKFWSTTADRRQALSSAGRNDGGAITTNKRMFSVDCCYAQNMQILGHTRFLGRQARRDGEHMVV